MTIKEVEIQLALGTLTFNMKWKLAYTKETSKEILTILSTDKHWYIRYYVATNPNTPKAILTNLSTDKDNSVRWRVAYNLNTPKKILTKL